MERKDKIEIKFLDYTIQHNGGSDGWTVHKKDGKFYESHLGGHFGGSSQDEEHLDNAKRLAIRMFMIARPEEFCHSIDYRMTGHGGAMQEWYKMISVLAKEDIEIPEGLCSVDSMNCFIGFKGVKI